jgi:hypothetical protein
VSPFPSSVRTTTQSERDLVSKTGLWPTYRATGVTVLVDRVETGMDSLNVRLRVDGPGGLAREMLAGGIEVAA